MASALSQIEAMKAMHIESVATSNSKSRDDGHGDVEMEEKENGNNKESTDRNLDGGDGTKLSSSLISKIESMAMELAKNRKATTLALTECEVSSERIVSEYGVSEEESYTVHNEVDRGVECLALSVNEDRVISGGTDSQIVVWNRSKRAVESVLKGHSQTVNAVAFYGENEEVLMSASSDSTAIIWKLKESEAQKVWQLKGVHDAAVLNVAPHPVADTFLSASRDGMWCVHSLSTQKTWSRVRAECGFNSFELHPDGQIVGIGCNDGMLRIWDIRSNQIGYSFEVGGDGQSGNGRGLKRGAISFNPNGYILGYSDGGDTNTVNVWDLRKIAKQKNKGFLQRIEAEQTVRCIQFSPSGQYLAVGQPRGIQLFHGKKWKHLKVIGDHQKMVTAIQFAQRSRFIVTASRDCKVRFIESRNGMK